MEEKPKKKMGRPVSAATGDNQVVRISHLKAEDVDNAKEIAARNGTSLAAVLGKMLKEYVRLNTEDDKDDAKA